ncbi:5-oxoprolinase subunit PxpB [Maribacter aestuarii]|uniref:5-oxoprolinase subunit PxpB n=1 Tax=Maribacter aestuarii TaxID=1130723 RepID=UPI00248C5AAF|nr:5-oxoprolinase subunit PxpB [Maribacter aestuarii]
MIPPPIHIKPFGIHAVLIEWPNEVSETVLNSILQFEDYLKDECLEDENWETVPSYNSLLLLNRTQTIEFFSISKKINSWYDKVKERKPRQRYLWRLPVSYDKEFGIDLKEISEKLNKSVEEIIALHTGEIYTVYGIGFLPGFMYLGGLNEALELPRKASPRLKVAPGSVAIAGKQTGIYPQESPGGWNIIGSCTVPIFNLQNENPCFVNVGDKIQFYEISRAEYDLHKIEAEVGIYQLEKIKLDA